MQEITASARFKILRIFIFIKNASSDNCRIHLSENVKQDGLEYAHKWQILPPDIQKDKNEMK